MKHTLPPIIYLALITVVILNSCGQKTQEILPIQQDITATVFASGILEPDSKNTLVAQTDGIVAKLFFEEGEAVNVGKLMAQIDNSQNAINAQGLTQQQHIAQQNVQNNAPLLQQTQQNIVLAKAKLASEQAMYQRYKSLFEQNVGTKVQLENAELALTAAKVNLQGLTDYYQNLKLQAQNQLIVANTQQQISSLNANYNNVTTYVKGIVLKQLKQIGDYVKKGETIAIISNTGHIYAKLLVDENNIAKIVIGQKTIVQLNTDTTHNYAAKIYEIMPSFDEVSQSYICKASFDTPLQFTIVGTQLQANIIINTKKNALLIPRNYLGYNNTVTLKKNKEIRHVKTGIVSSNWVEVLEGISKDDIIVTELVK